MNQACHRGGKLLLNEQCACSANSASCCVAPCLTRRRCRVLGGGGGGEQPGPQGALGLCWGAVGKGQSCLAAGGCMLPRCLPADSSVEMLGQQHLGEMGCEL